ncbi:NAD(P)/FAD-dependent oxidoreductase [Quadrisphaera sp. DSM 44207]|uniref:flavin-containing monooxygenase n=1 Tax=Quadrisphaera sp. DSM 44207 TaxID=1881057 RepID=UPI000890549C|nr:NAD(P)/FAD-dependent oxidoreductase [Quadrisphaera sp. DSM 44207]SDQ34930.1 Predicted flavoprotein CzcO associated with the cation diffusion facilitator CzcD [Quadrisphaera sp. DSM 44207]
MAPEHLDVLVIGAGLSGIGAAATLRARRPGTTLAVLEARERLGGTWDLFRYPGVRSDSDMATYGYGFRPWRDGTTLADGAAILRYLADTAREHGVEGAIRYGHRVVRASWSSERARWTVQAERTGPGVAPGTTVTLTCRFLHACTGYFRYEHGYAPDLPGADAFRGRLVHPQLWPEDLDLTGRRVVVIGSGATAVTLVPALAREAAHVTMLQRSPSWVASLPSRDPVADRLRRALPPRAAAAAVRWKSALLTAASYRAARVAPRAVGRVLLRRLAAQLPAGFDVATHFTPSYAPWDQRLCVVPDGDLFAALREGRAGVVTDRIETLTANGVRLASGRELAADVVVTATGLELLALGGMALSVDGQDVDLARTVAWRGMMLSGVPDFAFTFGYTHASWTLRVDLVSAAVCRLLDRLDAPGCAVVTPGPAPAAGLAPLIALRSGYVARGIAALPQQGPAQPWRVQQSHLNDRRVLRSARLTDGLRFTPAPAASPARAPQEAR